MSRVSKTTVEKRQIVHMIGAGAHKNSGAGGVGRGIENFITPDGAFPAFLQTAGVVVYERPKEDGNSCDVSPARSEPEAVMPQQSATVVTPRRSVQQPSPPQADDDEYDKELDRAEERERRIREATGKTPRHNVNNADGGDVAQPTEHRDPCADLEDDEDDEEKQPLENQCSRPLLTEVWTAEQDGSISIRDPCTGRHVKTTGVNKQRCRRVAQSFVTCILQVRNLVFAGYQDGHLRAFDAPTKELVFEKKKHAGAVNALVQWKNNIIFSCSDDFRIVMWRVGAEQPPDQKLQLRRKEKDDARRQREEEQRARRDPAYRKAMMEEAAQQQAKNVAAAPGGSPVQPALSPAKDGPKSTAVAAGDMPSFLHQFIGHANRVRCLRVEGDYLYSGGDDGMIRCWDIHQRTEVVIPEKFPLLAHPRGVLDLTFLDNYMLSAGSGGISIWDVEQCQCLQTFPFEEVNHMAVDPTSLLLWACSSKDGIITVIDLYSFEVIGQMDDFGNANIKTIASVTNSVATRLFFVVPSKGVTTVYTENSDTGMRQSYEPVNSETKHLYNHLDSLRERILSNEKSIREHRSQLWYIRSMDNYRKETAVKTMAGLQSTKVKQEYLERCLINLMKTRFNARQQILADTMALNNDKRLMFNTILKWYHFRRWGKDAYFRDFVTNSQMASTNRDLITRHLQNAIHHLEKKQAHTRDMALANALEVHARLKHRNDVFTTWRRYVDRAKGNRKLAEMLRLSHTRQQHFLMHVYFNKLFRNYRESRLSRLKGQASGMLIRTHGSVLFFEYYKKWHDYIAHKRFLKQRGVATAVAMKTNDNRLRFSTFALLRGNVARKKQERNNSAKEKLLTDIAEMQELLNNTPQETEQELDDMIKALEDELAATKQATVDARTTIVDLEERETVLMQEVGEPENKRALYEPTEEELEAQREAEEKAAKEAAAKAAEAAAQRGEEGEPAAAPPAEAAPAPEAAPSPKTASPSPSRRERKPPLTVFKQCDMVMGQIRPRLLNLRADLATIEEHFKKAGNTKAPKPTSTFAKAVKACRTQFQTFAPEGETLNDMDPWPIDPEAVQMASRATLKKALAPVRDAVIVWDYIRNKPNTLGGGIEGNVVGADEFTRNVKPIKMVIDRDFLLTADDPAAVSVRPGTTPRSGSATARSGSASGRKVSATGTLPQKRTPSAGKTGSAARTGRSSVSGATQPSAATTRPGTVRAPGKTVTGRTSPAKVSPAAKTATKTTASATRKPLSKAPVKK